MSLLIQITVIIHVIAGSAALISGGIAFVLRKKTVKHKPVGRFYFWMMSIVFVTAVFVSLVKGLLFLFFIGVLTYYYTLVAYRTLRLKELHLGQKPQKIDWAIQIVAALTFLGLISVGIISFLNGNAQGGIIPLIFGASGLYIVTRNSMVFINRPTRSNYWLKIHVGNMMGSYIGAFTAFLVNQTDIIPIAPVILWLAPSVLIVPVMIMEIRKIRSEPFPVTQR